MLKVDEFVMEAGEQGASDIHIVAGHPVSYRIHGTIVSRDETILTKEETTCLIKEYTTEQQYHIFQETGELDFSKTSQNGLRLRLNIFMEQDSPAMALRILASRIPSPKELGLPKVVTNLIHLRRGLVLVTGATGSGKSTTLAALIHEISKIFHKNIITLEDPIEYVHTREASVVSQREIGRDTRSYANALRAALRQDPDVILVGEMRDLETIAAAVTAAETGHLVFSTLHTNNAAAAIDRIIDVFPPHQQGQIRTQLADVLEGVIAQQLLPTKDGKGRVAAFEILLGNPAVRNLIREGKTYQLSTVIQTEKKSGMQTMDDSLYELYSKDMVSSDTILEYAVDPTAMKKRTISF